MKAEDVSQDDPFETLYAAGHRHYSQGRTREALRVFRVLLLLSPTDERAWLGLGLCHERMHQLDVAMSLYTSGALAACPGARCWLARSRLLRAVGRFDEAADAHARGVQSAERVGDWGTLKLVDEEEWT